MTFHSLSIFCHGRVLSLTQLHTLQRRQELHLWLFHFELLQNLVKVCTHRKILSSVLIYLYRSWCPICKQLYRGLSLKNLLSKPPLCFSENSTSFPINNMSFTYTYQKGCSAPTHFLVNTGFTTSLYKTICFDHLIKKYIPTPRCLHQSIDGCWSLHTLLSPLGLTKPSGCIIYNSFLINPLRNVVLISICQIS